MLLKQIGENQRLLEEVAYFPGPGLWEMPHSGPGTNTVEEWAGQRLGREVGSGDFEIMSLVPFSLRAVC